MSQTPPINIEQEDCGDWTNPSYSLNECEYCSGIGDAMLAWVLHRTLLCSSFCTVQINQICVYWSWMSSSSKYICVSVREPGRAGVFSCKMEVRLTQRCKQLPTLSHELGPSVFLSFPSTALETETHMQCMFAHVCTGAKAAPILRTCGADSQWCVYSTVGGRTGVV